MGKLYLIRHGEPEFPEGKKVCLSRTDLPLSDNGRRQGEALSKWLASKKLDKVYTSPSLRARQTAAYLHPEPEPVPGLEEIHMGVWEGMSFANIRSRFSETYQARGRDIAHVPPPGGESFAECLVRVKPVFERLIMDAAGDIAVVAHAGVNRAILCWWQGMELGKVLSIPQPYGGISLIAFSGGAVQTVFVGELLERL